MALISRAFGATAAGIGHFQNTWHFTPGRWQPSTGKGGGGESPPRFFSTALWGTIIYPDELVRLPQQIRSRVLTTSPYSAQLSFPQVGPWSRWNANKHLIHVISAALQPIYDALDPRAAALDAITILQEAVTLHGAIAANGLALADNTNSYQSNWMTALQNLLDQRSADFEYLDVLR
jgi:hypothetical protein